MPAVSWDTKSAWISKIVPTNGNTAKPRTPNWKWNERTARQESLRREVYCLHHGVTGRPARVRWTWTGFKKETMHLLFFCCCFCCRCCEIIGPFALQNCRVQARRGKVNGSRLVCSQRCKCTQKLPLIAILAATPSGMSDNTRRTSLKDTLNCIDGWPENGFGRGKAMKLIFTKVLGQFSFLD